MEDFAHRYAQQGYEPKAQDCHHLLQALSTTPSSPMADDSRLCSRLVRESKGKLVRDGNLLDRQHANPPVPFSISFCKTSFQSGLYLYAFYAGDAFAAGAQSLT
jgi:hypothetical protein